VVPMIQVQGSYISIVMLMGKGDDRVLHTWLICEVGKPFRLPMQYTQWRRCWVLHYRDRYIPLLEGIYDWVIGNGWMVMLVSTIFHIR
jgi:hypothetical protein